MLYEPSKRKFAKGHFKGQKRPYFCFSTLRVFIRSINIGTRGDTIDMASMLEFRYRSLLHPTFKKIACYY